MKYQCVLKPVFVGKNIMEPAIKHEQSEKKGITTLQLAEPPYSVKIEIYSVPYIKWKASKTSASGGKIYKLGLCIAYLTTSTS